MNGELLLKQALSTFAERREQYGDAKPLFEQIGRRWSLTLGVEVAPSQVVLCLLDLTLARLSHTPTHHDSIVDLAGYAACLQEVVR